MKIDDKELDKYFKQILGLENWKHLYHNDSLHFLHKLVIRQVTRVYFHNLQIASTPLAQRKVPSESEIVATNLRGEGGNCLHLNYFMRILLQSVGYRVSTIASTIGTMDRNHCMNVVHFSDKESYLVDVACGCPSPLPIPLHDLPFSMPCCNGSTNEFRQISNSEFGKFQIGGGFFREHLPNGEMEKILIKFDLTPVDFSSFQEGMTKVWTDEANSPFCRNLFLFRQYFTREGNHDAIIPDVEQVKEENDTAHQLEFILVFGRNILFGSEFKRVVKQFSSYEEMVPLIFKYFPKLDAPTLDRSIKYLNTMDPIDVRL